MPWPFFKRRGWRWRTPEGKDFIQKEFPWVLSLYAGERPIHELWRQPPHGQA